MQKVFDSLLKNDKRAEEVFNLKNGILMENAARSLAEEIKKRFFKKLSGAAFSDGTVLNPYEKMSSKKKTVLQIICGSGDNGGDGLALARVLFDFFEVIAVCAKEPKSELCKLQKSRLDALGIKTQKKPAASCGILVDALFGTGFKGELNKEDEALLKKMNNTDAFKIACDIPSGINVKGEVCAEVFKADLTVSMGSLKTAFFSDAAKDFTGEITIGNLGLPNSKYETESNTFLLEKSDFRPPRRILQNVHKGSFGHAAVVCGEKPGAALLAASAALKIGAGLVTVCGEEPKNFPPDLMYSPQVINGFSALSIGNGLGTQQEKTEKLFAVLKEERVWKKPLVLDADILSFTNLPAILPKLKKAILTPHPKEFRNLMEISGLGRFSIEEIQKNRFEFLRLFCRKYPNIITVLKGANILIGAGEKIFINHFGSAALAKAGSGDVLTGIIAGLAAQGYSPLEAALNGSLALAFAAQYTKNTYSLTASALTENLTKII